MLKTKFNTSNECVKFVQNILRDSANEILDQTIQFLEKNDRKRGLNFCRAVKSDLLDKDSSKKSKKFGIITENFGYNFFENFTIPKNMYMIDLHDTIEAILSAPEIIKHIQSPRITNNGIYKSFFDGSFYKENYAQSCDIRIKLFLSLYADEINICCPIGN